ncbi:MAG: hypothetical protein DCC65_08055 [Planctomycetota bacterium]|nr:MAG: hypothetical protein DCC65_08055 [Planctomycetota bacterium]
MTDQASPLEAAAAASPGLPPPWHLRRRIVFPLLAVLYPLGLYFLIKAPRPRRVGKVFAAVFFLPIFCVVALLPLKPYWKFAGRMKGPVDFSLDLDRLLNDPDARLEAHRAKQEGGTAGSSAAAMELTKLSWTDFRGPARDGVCAGETISLDWQKDPPRELWRQPIGGGHASFVVGHGRAYTIEQRRKQEVITSYDLATGRELWATAYDASFEETLGGNGPRATPTLRGDRLYSLGAQGDLYCVDALSGRPVWNVNVLRGGVVANLEWGLSGSPLVVDDKVIVTASGKEDPSLFAFHAADGKPAWTCNAGPQGYTSPMPATLCGVRQFLNLGGTELRGVDIATGRILWRHPWKTYMWINSSQPLPIGGDRLFLSAAYDHGCSVIQLARPADNWTVKELWFNNRMKNKFSTCVIYNGHAYGLDEAILCCVDLETGERRWKGGRYNYGSLLLVGDHLLVLTEEPADLVLVAASPEAWKEIGRMPVFKERTWNNFVLIGGRLLARNDRWMACYDLRPRESVAALN